MGVNAIFIDSKHPSLILILLSFSFVISNLYDDTRAHESTIYFTSIALFIDFIVFFL